MAEKSRFTSDRRGRGEASWAGENDWNAGVSENVDVIGDNLVGQRPPLSGEMPDPVDENFAAFDTSTWSLYGDATYSSAGEYVQLHPPTDGDNGRLGYDGGMPDQIQDWAVDVTWSQNNSDTDDFSINWFAEDPSSGTKGAGVGYVLGFDYWRNEAYVIYRGDGESVPLASEYISEATGALSARLEWTDGSFVVYYNGTELMSGAHASPDYSKTGLFFGSWTGGQESYKRVHSVSFEWIR